MSKHIRRWIDTRAGLSLPIFLDLETRQISVISIWLNVQDLGLLDMAVSSSSARRQWLIILKSIYCKAMDVWRHSDSSLRWAMMRSLNVSHILANLERGNRICDLTFEAAIINGSRTFDEALRDDCLSLIWEKCKKVLSIDLSSCEGITDIGISVVVDRCSQLQTMNLIDCTGITDIGLAAIGTDVVSCRQSTSDVVRVSQTSACQHWVTDVCTCRRLTLLVVRESQTSVYQQLFTDVVNLSRCLSSVVLA
jgi:hypothetical protein